MRLLKNRATQFVLICYALSLLVFFILKFLGVLNQSYLIALFYMSCPLTSAILVQKLNNKPIELFMNFKKIKLKYLFTPILYFLLFICITTLLIFIFGNILEYRLWGTLSFSSISIRDELIKITGDNSIPVLPKEISVLIFIVSVLGAIISGYSINLVFSYGEEAGWRRFLFDELKSFGFIKANLIIGFIWAIWHIPLILVGLNYPTEPLKGTGLFILYCCMLSTFLSYLRIKANSVLAPSAFHGMLNGIGSALILYYKNGHELVASIVGLAGIIALGIMILWISFIDKKIIFNHFGNKVQPTI